MSIAEKLTQVAENVPKVYKAGQSSMVDESKLIPKTVSGSYISVDDVSEIPHKVACKVESVNLFDKDNINALVGAYFASSGIIIAANETMKIAYIPCSPNTDYVVAKMKSARFAVGEMDKIPEVGDAIHVHSGFFATEDTSLCVFKTTETAKYICLWYYNATLDTDITIEEIEATIMIHKGTTALPYTPFVKPEEVKVTRTGKNLAQENDFTSDAETGYKIYRAFTPIPANTTFTVSGDFSTDSGKDMFYRFMSADGTDLSYGYITQSQLPKWTRTATCNGEVAFMYFYSSGNAPQSVGHTLTVNNFQIELSDKATAYEPYNGQTLTPATDGTVEGMTSVSPYMNVFSDTEGVNIEVEYNKSWGMQTEYDRFWDAFQFDGTRTAYTKGFTTWPDACFYPKYDLIMNGSSEAVFTSSSISNFAERLEECGIIIDTTNATSLYQAFSYMLSNVRLPTINATKATHIGSICRNCRKLVTFDKLILNDTGTTNVDNAFTDCDSLANITIEGVIGNSISFQDSPLTKASITSIIEHLSTTATGQTLTLKLSAVNTAFETSAGAGDGSTSAEFAALVATKTNWTITMI